MAKARPRSASKPKQPSASAPAPAAAPSPPASPSSPGGRSARQIIWLHVLTVISAAILIGAEVFGAAFAASWAVATLFGLGYVGARALDIFFLLCGVAIMVQFVRAAHRIEPFTRPA